MPRKFCRDWVLEVLESVSEPISTKAVQAALPNYHGHTVQLSLRALYKDTEVLRTGRGTAHLCYMWQRIPPLIIRVYEEDTEADRRLCAGLDKAIALAKREREQR